MDKLYKAANSIDPLIDELRQASATRQDRLEFDTSPAVLFLERWCVLSSARRPRRRLGWY
ncbi:hypothetical protein E5D57_013410 [Metarhizium anisopliae]|nr:hypothetical protein E5D57_013410 [Metarhizium anisopliae]